MRYEVAFLDLGGVVVSLHADRLLRAAAQATSRSVDEVREAVCHHELLPPFERGQMSPRQFYAALGRRVPMRWSFEEFVGAWNDMFAEMPDSVRLMERLRRRHRLVALSNTNVLHLEHLKATVPAMALFDAIVASCDVGYCKPEAGIYEAALRRAGVRAERALYVDDRADLIDAARVLGITAVQFVSGHQVEEDLRALGVI